MTLVTAGDISITSAPVNRLPSLTELFAICDYFQITPAEFFDPSMGNPTLKKHVVSGLDLLSERDLQLIQSIIAHLIQRG